MSEKGLFDAAIKVLGSYRRENEESARIGWSNIYGTRSVGVYMLCGMGTYYCEEGGLNEREVQHG